MYSNSFVHSMLLYFPPWSISTQCSVLRLFGSPAYQRHFPVSSVVSFIQAFFRLDQHHLCEKYRKPMNHRFFSSALPCSAVMLVVMFLKYSHSPSVCMETRPSYFWFLQYCLAISQLKYLVSKWYSEQACLTFSECTVKEGKTTNDITNKYIQAQQKEACSSLQDSRESRSRRVARKPRAQGWKEMKAC